VVVAGVAVALLVVGIAVFAPVIAPHAPDAPNFALIEAPPGPNAWFGTDRFARDILSRIIFGSSISLYVAGVSIGASLLLGGALGLTAGMPAAGGTTRSTK
jgi:peptide/nickel transport system permease protein